jgi:dipeptidase E
MQHIIAIGGDAFASEADNPTFERYIIEQTGKERPSVCYLPTASADPVNGTLNFFKAYARLDARLSYLSLFSPPTDIEAFLLTHDVIYVGGGNTKSMLAVWREWNLPAILRKALDNGTVLAGVSAGAICWFEQGLSDSIPGQFIALPCLGFLPGSCSPHFDGQPERRPRYHQLLMEDKIVPGYGLDDGAALHFIDGKPVRVVTSRPEAKVYRVEKVGGEVRETVIEI